MRFCRVLAFACVLSWPSLALAQGSATSGQAAPPDGITRLVDAIAAATEAGDSDALSALAAPDVPAAQLSELVQSLTSSRATRSAVKERDRAPTESGRIRLLVETFTERDGEGRVSSWRMDVAPRQSVDGPWVIRSVERLTVVSGLFRLAIDAATEYEIHDLVITAPDLTLTLPSGMAFVSRTPDGPTALVLIGRGRMDFTPGPEAERGQVRIFSGADALKTDFSAAFLRLHPGVFEQTVAASALKPRAPDSGHLRRAMQIFETYLPKSFLIDLNDLSTARWSLLPSQEDFVAEVETSRFGPLTYARASAEPEDISFFDRRRHRNIAVYPSKERLESRGPFFSEDDRADYDITNYEVDATFAPDRAWVDGTAKLSLRARSSYFSTLTLRLAEPLVVRSVTSPQFGRLLHLRVVGQNNVLIGFPGTIVSDTDFDLVITYGGRLPPQAVDREAITVQQPERREDVIIVPPEPLYTYSNRSYWYPQAPVTDYATARISVTVPADLEVVASGAAEGPPVPVPSTAGQRARKRFVFEARKPTRYLSVVISRFQFGPASRLTLGDDEEPITLTVAANPRQTSKMRSQSEKAADILKFYTSLLGDLPYDAFTLALTESDVPGGHSPAYFAMLNQPLPTSPFVWNNDPVSFQNYPSFFIAHEIAHQWWGQAVGWKNYHEQWISEGFAQYFAALYAERERGPEVFAGVLRQMRKWAIDLSPQGPVYLGYRLGHIRADGRTFRALVYNKGAMVLHMLRRLVGDDAFFAGLRDFYMTWRYKKAGTDDFRVAMENAAGRPLARFFDRWIYGSGIPVVRFTSSVAGSELKVRIEQKGEVYDLPVTVSIAYADGTSEDVVVPILDKVVERTIPLKGTVRSVDLNKDAGALVEVERE